MSRVLRRILAALVTVGAGLVAAPAAYAATSPVQGSVDALVSRDRFVGVLASVRQPDGRTRNYTAGVADLRTGAKMPVDWRVRIASNTKKTVAAPGFDSVGGSRYGLGLATFVLSCGGFAWAHVGIAPGYVSVVGITASGKAATVVVNSMVPNEDANRRLERSLDIALCRG